MCHGQNMTIGPPQWELFTSCISSCLPNLNLDVQFVTENTCFIISSLSMDCFKGTFAGKSHISWENNSGFRFSDFPNKTNRLSDPRSFPPRRHLLKNPILLICAGQDFLRVLHGGVVLFVQLLGEG